MSNNDKVIRAAKVTVSYAVMIPVGIIAILIIAGAVIAFTGQMATGSGLIAIAIAVPMIIGDHKHKAAKHAEQLAASRINQAKQDQAIRDGLRRAGYPTPPKQS